MLRDTYESTNCQGEIAQTLRGVLVSFVYDKWERQSVGVMLNCFGEICFPGKLQTKTKKKMDDGDICVT